MFEDGVSDNVIPNRDDISLVNKYYHYFLYSQLRRAVYSCIDEWSQQTGIVCDNKEILTKIVSQMVEDIKPQASQTKVGVSYKIWFTKLFKVICNFSHCCSTFKRIYSVCSLVWRTIDQI